MRAPFLLPQRKTGTEKGSGGAETGRVLGSLAPADLGLGWERSCWEQRIRAGISTKSPCPMYPPSLQVPLSTYPRATSAVTATGFRVLQIGGRSKVSVASAGCCRMQLCCLPGPGVGQDATSAEWLIFFLPGVLLLSFSRQYNYEVICITFTLCQILKIATFEKELLPFTVPH